MHDAAEAQAWKLHVPFTVFHSFRPLTSLTEGRLEAESSGTQRKTSSEPSLSCWWPSCCSLNLPASPPADSAQLPELQRQDKPQNPEHIHGVCASEP